MDMFMVMKDNVTKVEKVLHYVLLQTTLLINKKLIFIWKSSIVKI